MKLFNKNLLINLLLLFGSIVFCFILFEIYLRLFDPQIFEIHPQGMYVANEAIGYSFTPDFKGIIQRAEFNCPVTINEKALRGKVYDRKKDDVYRILVLGDSQAFGFGVTENETFSVYLENQLNAMNGGKYEVINAGVPGYGTIDQLNFLKSRAPEINPDLVILQFLSNNDFEENRYSAKSSVAIKAGWLTSDDSSTNSSTGTLPFLRRAEYWIKDNFHSAKFLSERVGYLLLKSGYMGDMEKVFWGEDISSEDEEIFEQTIIEMFNYTKQHGYQFVFLYTTGQSQVLATKEPQLNSEIIVKRIMLEQGIEWINIYKMMRVHSERTNLYYPVDGHWKPAGHRFVAEAIYNKLTEKLITIND